VQCDAYFKKVYLKCVYIFNASFFSVVHPFEKWVDTEGTFFISSLNVFADEEEEEQAANISVAEQDFKFMDFARR
jgi:hypothetical protein